MFNYLVYLVLYLFFSAGLSEAQLHPFQFQFTTEQGRIISNGIVDIVEDGSRIWFGTNKGVMVTPDNGKTFKAYGVQEGLGKGSVTALSIHNGVVWVATGFDSTTKEGELPTGGGLAYSNDRGQTWHYLNQPVDPKTISEYKPTTTNVQNVTYDIAFQGDTIWIASWGGGIRKSIDDGMTWQVNPPDNFPFDVLQYLNHRGFAVISARNGLWVGTAGGINKSTDGGRSWTRYTPQNGSGISGSFVTALAEQRINNRSIIWAATWKAEGQDEFYGVSKTENNGLTWEVTLEGQKAHNFGFHGDEVYVATDAGLWKSDDLGKSWAKFPPVVDALGNLNLTTIFNSTQYVFGYLWAGTDDGLVRTSDNGLHWELFRAFQPTQGNNTPKTYAYPNPFSPSRHNRLDEDGFVRMQYSTTADTKVSVCIYDFALKKVATVIDGAARSGGREYSEIWNGKNDRGDQVANGVYFYKIELAGQGTLWGKIVIID